MIQIIPFNSLIHDRLKKKQKSVVYAKETNNKSSNVNERKPKQQTTRITERKKK